MKRFLLSSFAFALVAVPLMLAAAVFLCFEDRPSVSRSAELTPAHIERAKRVLEAHDPRGLGGGGVRELRLGVAELDLAANYLAHRYGGGSARIDLDSDTVELALSVEVPHMPFGRFLNIVITVRETPGLPALEALSIGRVTVPAWAGKLVLAGAARAMATVEEYRLAAATIRGVAIDEKGMRVVYAWQEDLPDRLRAAALPLVDRERLKIYHEGLVRVAGQARPQGGLPLPRLLVPLAAVAVERSAGGDAQAESRALIAVVAAYVSGSGITAIVPQAREWPRAARRTVTLAGRRDLAQHFTVSAALAAFAGSPLADAIGLYKEVEDSRGGSGFSFKDIAADRAGTVFGELATRSADSARTLQQNLAAGVNERDMMPDVANLPEFLSDAQFRRRFGGVGAPAYKNMMRKIERRIAACTLYRQ